MTRKPQSIFSTQLAALESVAWSLFVALSVLIAAVVPGEIGEAQARAWIADPSAQAALIQLLRALDGAWITLAAINTYLLVARAEGIAIARRWAVLIFLGSGAAAWIGARTGFPFGPRIFTDNLGMRVGHVLPFTWPLLWFVVLLNSHFVARRFLPRAGHSQITFAAAALTLLT